MVWEKGAFLEVSKAALGPSLSYRPSPAEKLRFASGAPPARGGCSTGPSRAQAVPAPRKILICVYLHNTPRSLCDQLSSLRSALRLLPATAAPQPSATPSVLRPLSATERGPPGTPGFLTSGANPVLTPEPLAQLPNISPHPLHSATPKFSASV